MNLTSFYKMNFSLMKHHNWSLSDVENMMPWEREIYTNLLMQYLEEENMKARHAKQKNK